MMGTALGIARTFFHQFQANDQKKCTSARCLKSVQRCSAESARHAERSQRFVVRRGGKCEKSPAGDGGAFEDQDFSSERLENSSNAVGFAKAS